MLHRLDSLNRYRPSKSSLIKSFIMFQAVGTFAFPSDRGVRQTHPSYYFQCRQIVPSPSSSGPRYLTPPAYTSLGDPLDKGGVGVECFGTNHLHALVPPLRPSPFTLRPMVEPSSYYSPFYSGAGSSFN